jgi:hypothetical protein
MANVLQSLRFIGVYLLSFLIFFLLGVASWAIYLNLLPGNSSEGLGLFLALPLMLILYSIFYFFVPGASLVALFFLGNFILKDRGSKLTSISTSVLLATTVWALTFPVAGSLINVVYASNYFLMIKDGSESFVNFVMGTNLAGLIAAVIWVKLRPSKAKSY